MISTGVLFEARKRGGSAGPIAAQHPVRFHVPIQIEPLILTSTPGSERRTSLEAANSHQLLAPLAIAVYVRFAGPL